MIAVLVPTVNRAELLEPLVANIHDTTITPHRVYLVMEDHDHASLAAADGLDAVGVVGSYGSNAAAVNAGYHASVEPFVAILNDDIRCTPDWDIPALARFSDSIHIVGINQGDGRCTSFLDGPPRVHPGALRRVRRAGHGLSRVRQSVP